MATEVHQQGAGRTAHWHSLLTTMRHAPPRVKGGIPLLTQQPLLSIRAPCRVLCDAALFDAKAMRWTAVEPTPFSRCAHSCVVLPATAAAASGTAARGHQDRPGLAGERWHHEPTMQG